MDHEFDTTAPGKAAGACSCCACAPCTCIDCQCCGCADEAEGGCGCG